MKKVDEKFERVEDIIESLKKLIKKEMNNVQSENEESTTPHL